MEFGSSVLNAIAGFYNSANDELMAAKALDIHHKFVQLEAVLTNEPYFAGSNFSMVDAVFGPVFRYFEMPAQRRIRDSYRRVVARRNQTKADCAPSPPRRP